MKPKQPNFSKFLTLSFGLAAAGISVQSVQAAPLAWDGATNGVWATDTNWNPDQTPTTSDDLTILGPANVAGILNINVNASNAFAKTINFTNTAATTIQSNSGVEQTLTLQSGLTTGVGAVDIGTTTSSTRVTVTLGANQTWDIGAGGLTTNGLKANFVVTKTGTGTWTMQNSSSAIGGVTLDNGTIQLNGNGSVNIFGSSGTFTLGTAANPANNVALQSTSSSSTNLVANIVVTAGAGTRTINYSSNGGTALAFAGTVTLNKDLIAKHTNTGGGGLQFSNTVSGVGGLDLTGNTGLVTLTGSNTYSGATTLAGGRLNLKNQLAAQNSIINLTGTTATALIFDSTIGANAFTIGGLASTGSGSGKDIALVNSTVSGVTPTPTAIGIALTLGNSTADASYAGVLSGAGSIIKTGSNAQTFSGANAYTGGTALNGGTLVYNNGAALGTSGNITFGGGTLKYGSGITTDLSARIASGTSAGAIKIDLNGQSVSYATALTGSQSGGLVLSDSGSGGILRLTLANAYTGGTILNSGELDLDNNGGLGSGALTINGGTLVSRTTSRTLSNTVTVGGDFALNKAANGLNFNLSGTIDLGGAVRTVTVSNGTGSSIATFSNVVSNSNGGLTKAGAGTLVLTGANTYTGATSVTEGTLSVSGSGTLGNVNNSLAVSSGATVDLNGTNQGVGALSGAGTIDKLTVAGTHTLTVGNNNATGGDFSGAIKNTTGTLAVTKSGSGTQTFSTTNSYSGDTSITGGTLAATASGALGSGPTNINGGKLQVANNSTLANAIKTGGESAASATVGKIQSTGNNILSGNIDFSNTGGLFTNIISTSGTLTLGGDMSTTLGSGRTFNFGAAGEIASNGIIADGTSAVSVSKLGAGTLTLSGANSYTGTTTVSAGTLAINGNQSAATGAVSVSNALTRLIGTGTVGGDTTINTGAIQSAGSAIANVNKIGKQTFDETGAATADLTYGAGSIFEWDLNTNKDTDGYDHDSNIVTDNTNVGTRGEHYDAVDVTGTLTVSATAIFRVVLGSTVGVGAGTFWQENQSWTDIFGGGFTPGASFTNGLLQVVDTAGNTYNQDSLFTGSGYGFSVSGTTLTWSAVPEPTSALAGLLIGAGLLSRRRA